MNPAEANPFEVAVYGTLITESGMLKAFLSDECTAVFDRLGLDTVELRATATVLAVSTLVKADALCEGDEMADELYESIKAWPEVATAEELAGVALRLGFMCMKAEGMAEASIIDGVRKGQCNALGGMLFDSCGGPDAVARALRDGRPVTAMVDEVMARAWDEGALDHEDRVEALTDALAVVGGQVAQARAFGRMIWDVLCNGLAHAGATD